jgi:uncharacterized protein YggE
VRAVTTLAALLVCAGSSNAQEQGPVIITTGTAIVQRVPDVAIITVAAEARARSPRDAQQQNAAAMDAVARRLTELSIPAAARRTLGLRVDQEFDNVNGRRLSRGYVARNILEVRLEDVTRAGEVADAAVQAGATSVEGIHFELKDRQAAEREALKLAVADARARAEAAAAGAGRAVDRILKIEDGERSGGPRPMMAMRAEVTTPVDPGLIEIRASVTLTVSMK